MPEAPNLDDYNLTEKNKKTLQFIEDVTSKPDDVQRQVLTESLSQNADVEYLNRHGLSGDTDRENFKKLVPVVTYEDLQNDITRIANGDKSPILSSHPISEFLTSSGTSGGERKLMPTIEDELGRRSLLYSRLMPVMNRFIPGLDKGKEMSTTEISAFSEIVNPAIDANMNRTVLLLEIAPLVILSDTNQTFILRTFRGALVGFIEDTISKNGTLSIILTAASLPFAAKKILAYEKKSGLINFLQNCVKILTRIAWPSGFYKLGSDYLSETSQTYILSVFQDVLVRITINENMFTISLITVSLMTFASNKILDYEKKSDLNIRQDCVKILTSIAWFSRSNGLRLLLVAWLLLSLIPHICLLMRYVILGALFGFKVVYDIIRPSQDQVGFDLEAQEGGGV